MAIVQDWNGSGLEHDLRKDFWKPSHAFAILAGIRWDEELYPPDPCFIYYGHVEKTGDGFEWVYGIRELEGIASRLEYYWASQSDEGKKPGYFINWSISKLHRPEWLDWALSERHRPDWRDWAIKQDLDLDKLCARSTENIEGKKTDNPDDDWNVEAVQVATPVPASRSVIEDPKPWRIVDPRDPKPEQPWYTPARYFARQLVIDDSSLLTKRNILAKKIGLSLVGAGIYKRGGKKPHDAGTILKALSKVSLG